MSIRNAGALRLLAACLISCAAAPFGPAQAQQPAAATPAATDRQFVSSALTSGEALAALRELARRKAQHPALRAYVENSPPAGALLLEPLRARHPQVPAHVGARLDYLQPLGGVTFDRAVLDAEIRQQQLLLELAEQEARAGADPELRRMAETALPGLRRDLARAHQVAAQVATAPLVPTAPPAATAPVPAPAYERSTTTTDLNLRMMEQIERNEAANAAAPRAASPPPPPTGLPPVTPQPLR